MPRALRALMTLAVAGALGIAGAGAAHASAYGASPIAPFTYEDDGIVKSVPRGCALIHSVMGTGLDINAQTANVDCAGLAAMRNGLFCDVEIEFSYTDLDGAKTVLDDDDLGGCRTLGIRLTNGKTPKTFESGGKICATLYVEDVKRTTSCHTVSA